MVKRYKLVAQQLPERHKACNVRLTTASIRRYTALVTEKRR
jgi:hypothetical protein